MYSKSDVNYFAVSLQISSGPLEGRSDTLSGSIQGSHDNTTTATEASSRLWYTANLNRSAQGITMEIQDSNMEPENNEARSSGPTVCVESNPFHQMES